MLLGKVRARLSFRSQGLDLRYLYRKHDVATGARALLSDGQWNLWQGRAQIRCGRWPRSARSIKTAAGVQDESPAAFRGC